MYHLTALVTLLAILFYFFVTINVSRSRTQTGVKVPAMSGHPDFERAFRIQLNTLQWMPIFLPSLWLFAIYISDSGAAALHRLFEGRRKTRPGIFYSGYRGHCAVGGGAGSPGIAAGVGGDSVK